MKRKHVLTLWVGILALAGSVEIFEDLYSQRRGRGRSYNRGSMSRYPSSRSRTTGRSYSGNYQRGSFKNYGLPEGAINREAWNRSRPQSRSGTQSLETRQQNLGERANQPGLGQDGTAQRDLAGGGSLETSRTTQGNTTTRNTTLTRSDGSTATNTRQVKREGDEIQVEGRGSTSRGGSRESSSEIKLDDGRVEKIERDTQITDRFGETIERESELKRDDDILKYKGKTETSTGREVKTEAEIARGVGGRVGAVGEIDTKYWGDYDFAHGRGPRGRGTAVYGPYGGALVTTLPNGYGRVSVYSRPYYYCGYNYYYPYYWGGAYYYGWMYPPYGSYYWYLPSGYTSIYIGGSPYYTHNHVYYQQTIKQGKAAYEVVAAPSGARTSTLPTGYATVTSNDQTYYFYGNTFYRQVLEGGKPIYVVVEKPAGLTSIEKLPADFEPIPLGATTFFKVEEKHYLPYREGEKEYYILVDAPPAPESVTESATAASENRVSLTLAEGTVVKVRTSGDLDSGSNRTGEHYTAYLDGDLTVDGTVVVATGSRVYGRLIEVEKAGSMGGKARLRLELTDIVVGEQILPISTAAFEVDGKSAGTLKQIGVGAGVGALVGAIADGGEGALIGSAIGAGAGTAVAAATPGKQVKIPAQTLLEFKLDQPLRVTTSTSSAE